MGLRFGLAQGAGGAILHGFVQDSTGRPVAFASATLWDCVGGKALAFSLTGPDGRFQIRGMDTMPSVFRMVLEHLQMQRVDSLCLWQGKENPHTVFIFRMQYAPRMLEEIIVRARPPAMIQHGDTLVYDAARFADGHSRKVEDLLRRLPGFQVSSDGRIHVNGREVDRILIDGDDLTERNYRLLSQHLQAAMVDKVEVISAYQPDRLLAQVERSDNVGINLRTDHRGRDRLTLDLSSSLGTSGRHRYEAQSAWLSAKVKWLSSWQANNISSQSGILPTATLKATSDDIEEATSFSFPLQTGRIVLPSLERAYVRDSRDASMLQVLSTRVGRYARLRGMTALGGSSWQALSVERGEYKTPDAGAWMLQADRSFQESLARQSATLVWIQDRGAKHIGYWALQAGKNQGQASMFNRLSGAVHDSALERIDNHATTVQWKTAHTFSWRKNQVAKLQYVFTQQQSSQAFAVLTGRWGQAFTGSPLGSFFQQGLAGVLRSQEADITIHRRGRRMDGKLRWDLQALTHRYTDRLEGGLPVPMMAPFIRAGSTLIRQQQAGVSYCFEGPLRPGWALEGALGLGPGLMMIQRAGDELHAAGSLYRAQCTVRKGSAGGPQLSLRLGSWKELPAPELFLPAYLDGDATLRSPAAAIALANRNKLEFACAHHDLPRVRSLVGTMTAGYDRGLYVPYVERRKEYLRVTRVPAARQYAARFHLHAERYVDAIRIKWVSDWSWMGSQADGWLNGIATRLRSAQTAVDQKAVTALEGWFQVEGGGRTARMWNESLPVRGQAVRYQLWQHHAYLRVKADWKEKAFLAVRYARWHLAQGASVGTLDLFGSVVFGKSLRLSLTGHNLTNVSKISLRSIATNEQQEVQNSLVGRYLLLGVVWSL
ncbi:MAG: TonB-dependent receptor [Bacteroidetes bacterium]|nr:TonB-dependent receptor [Bacteroidota bacterium]